ncbi:hypothetical protein ACLB2K_042195 [Fragaria x ananassa]
MGGLLSDGKFILGIIFALWGICSATETPANFVFGDSLVEVGNNNYISRGFKGFTPPYLAPTTAGPVILRGVNYASGGAGILNETGKIFGGRINMDAQIDNFANTRQDIISGIGVPAALKLLKRALFSLTIGSNDFINNYLAPIISEAERKSIPPETFVGILVARFRLQITRLYSLGAKKIVMVNVGPIGCIPYQREVNRVADPDSCAAFSNQLARSFNAKLKTLVTELNKNLPGAKFVYADVYSIVEDIIDNYKSYGFQNTNSACCRVAGRYGGLIPCGPQPSKVCVNRSKYVFWDAYHPSDASNVIIARRLLYGNSSDISPMNIIPFCKNFLMGGLFLEGTLILGIIFALWRMCTAIDCPANFVFGDSLVEVGNNNYIPSLSKADYPPNGIDFGRPNGRYTNGRTTLGFKEFTPPYLAPTTAGSVILRGANYASGGGGILNETGKIYVGRINMDAQIDYFANTRQDIISSIGLPAAVELLRRSLFSVEIGSNDFLSNYLVPVITEVKRKLTPPETFVGILIARFRLQLTRLYKLGARKMVVINIGPIGCIPFEREVNLVADPDMCAEFPNQLARLFNAKLRTLVTELNKNLPGARFVYANAYSIVEDIIDNYISYGFENRNSACCSTVGRYGGLIACGPQPTMVCEDRSKYVFWDPYHPSDASNMIIARRLLYGNSSDISPMNVVQLLQAS